MEPFEHNDQIEDAALLQTVTVLSTLLTALEVRYRALERKAGRDPSDQEDPRVARACLRDAVVELENLLSHLSASAMIALTGGEGTHVAAVRRFDDLMMLNQAGVLLQSIHQRLLSLYPAVREAIVEEARLLHQVQRGIIETEEVDFADQLTRFVERGRALGLSIHRELLGRT